MIHISIPTFQTLTDPIDLYNKYNVYDIHINGAFHASVRYNVLYKLHEKLIETFGLRLGAPDFPPKKLWRLDNKSLNERREGLTRYLQGVIKNPDVARHTILERNFLDFQIKSFSSSNPSKHTVKLEIFLPDGRSVTLDSSIGDSTNVVMQRLCNFIGISERNCQFFGIFLARNRNNTNSRSSANVLFDQICVRWLKNFESPYISQQFINGPVFHAEDDDDVREEHNAEIIPHRILIRRTVWDPSVEEPLLDDLGSLKLLYLQAVNDIQRSIFRVPVDVREKLAALQESNEFKQFLRLCHLQSEYGYELLAPVISDFPAEDTACELKVGRRQLVLEHLDGETLVQSILRSTRIKMWRVSHSDSQPLAKMTFQLEYLFAKEEFGTITLYTEQAVLLSLFLQSIAAEILRDHPNTSSPTFKFDDALSLKATESLRESKASSIIGDDLSIRSSVCNGINGGVAVDPLLKIISYQMPFLDGESFEDITDADI